MEFEICANFNLSIIAQSNVGRLRDQHRSRHFRSDRFVSDVYCFSKFSFQKYSLTVLSFIVIRGFCNQSEKYILKSKQSVSNWADKIRYISVVFHRYASEFETLVTNNSFLSLQKGF